MCGIAGIIAPDGLARGAFAPLDAVSRALRHRGPDSEGSWIDTHVALSHRRLVVVDPSPAGAQPMCSDDHLAAIAYNGELYNDADIRASLGGPFRSACDTETVLAAIRRWGPDALPRLRGMYAFAFVDLTERTLLLARDPLGIKPLYYAITPTGEVVFASEVAAVLEHPAVTRDPDPVTLRAYMSTIRTTLGERTLYRGIRTLLPGEWMLFNLDAPRSPVRRGITPLPAPEPGTTKAVIAESVRLHLRSDVPMCSLLSGGLDSTIIARETLRSVPTLRTYCSGAADAASGEVDDFAAARIASRQLGTEHHEAPVSRELFLERWREMVTRSRLPMSTPNEVAINEVARTLRSQGNIVALSGEGADELFGGYDLLLEASHTLHASGRVSRRDAAASELANASWVPGDALAGVLAEPYVEAEGGTDATLDAYDAEFARVGYDEEPDKVLSHLRVQRRINLAGLLARLDSATMLAGVEGRTPFADARVAAFAEALPMHEKFIAGPPGQSPRERAARTKRCLRSAYAEEIPREVLERPKASFPLPFQSWLASPDVVEPALRSRFAREIMNPAMVEALRANPAALWRVLWPTLNLSLWF